MTATRNRQAQSGYTLIEVVATVVLIGFIAAVAIPRFSGHFHRISMVSDLDILESTIVNIQNRSRTNHQDIQLTFTRSDSGNITGYSAGIRVQDDLAASTNAIVSENFGIGLVGSVSGGVATLLFQPAQILAYTSSGDPATVSIVAVQLEDPEGNVGAVEIDRISQSVRLVPPAPPAQ